MMKHLPIGVQTFSKLIKGNYLYIDKTREIYTLLASGGQYYFLSRPRRFGKSLLISTLKELFSGNKELFKGLWIYDKIEEKTYPVIHIDFLGSKYNSEKELNETLEYLIDQNAAAHGLVLKEKGYDRRFRELIMETSKKNQVVILVDEYDKPIIDFIETGSKEIARENQKVLKKFYSIIKSSDQYIRFVFITGVSKFSKVSVFSDLNNLRDITVSGQFASLLGYTETELRYYFEPYLTEIAAETGDSPDQLLEKIRKWYNGYSWDGKSFVYNPFSILNLFTEKRFGNFWFATGTPTFLINHIKNRKQDITALERQEVDGSIFESYDIENLEVVSMLFQTGYLTIKEIKPVGIKSQYILSYPNEEVKESFLKHFLADYTAEGAGSVGSKVLDLVTAVSNDDLEQFFSIIKSLFASIPSPLFIREKEAYYHTVIYLVLKLLGANIEVEVHTNKGRIDAVIETALRVYIMEFKMGTSAEALLQIKERKYHEKYVPLEKRIRLIGVGFDEKERNISDYVEENV